MIKQTESYHMTLVILLKILGR